MSTGLDYEDFLLPGVWLCLADLVHLALPSSHLICCDESGLSVVVTQSQSSRDVGAALFLSFPFTAPSH